MSGPRILFVAEAVTLAHVVRLVTLTQSLWRKGRDVVLASDPRYAPLIGPLEFPVENIHSMSAQQFQRAITRGSPIFDFPTLDRYVTDELLLFERLRPQVVVGDFRISLAVSARVAGIPFVNLTNAYWSPLARIRPVVPEFDWTRRVGLPIAQLAFRTLRRLGYMQHAVPINRVRRKYGLPSVGTDFRTALMDGDVTCFADAPEIIPISPLPAGQQYIGPVAWSPPVAPPDWFSDVQRRDRHRPLVYVALGSSGPAGGLQAVLTALAGLPLDVIASAAGRDEAIRVPPNARVAPMLPGDVACAAADLVVCNGGSPGTYQALACGKPVIGIATNMDQFLNMTAVEEAGCGRLFRSRSVLGDEFARTVTAMLQDGRLRESVSKMAEAISGRPTLALFEAAIESLAAGRPQAPAVPAAR